MTLCIVELSIRVRVQGMDPAGAAKLVSDMVSASLKKNAPNLERKAETKLVAWEVTR